MDRNGGAAVNATVQGLMDKAQSSLPGLLTPSAIAAQVACLLLVTLVWRRFLSPIADIPGPGWAAITRLWHMKEIASGHQNKTMSDLHDKHGYFVRIAPNEVSTTHPEAIKKLILTPQRKGHWYKMMRFPDWRFRTPMSELDPKAKVELSRQLASAYAMSNVIKSEEQVSGLVAKLLGWMDKHAESEEPMDLANFFTYTAFDVVGEMVFSKPFGFLDKGVDIDNCISQTVGFEAYISVAGFMQWLHNLLLANPFVTWLDIMPTNYLAKTSNTALEQRKANQDARFDFVAHWLKSHAENPKKLPYREVQSAVMSNVGAGSDTVSCVLQSFIYHMIRHPNAWQRVRQEIDEARAKHGLCNDAIISYADTQQLPFFHACVKETLRIFHPVTMGTPRVVPKGGVVIGGRWLPAGTTVSFNTYCANLSEDVWGSDAKTFNPDRWTGESAASLDKAFLPYSGGIGSCVGQHLARIELNKILTTIVRDYDIKQVDPAQSWAYHSYFTTVPGDWPVYIEKRKP